MCNSTIGFGSIKSLLLLKLEHIGIRGNVLGWIECFLTNFLRVTSSEEVPVSSGVPQGTVQTPLLFLILIDDIETNINSRVSSSYVS